MDAEAIDEFEEALLRAFVAFQTDSFNRALGVLRDVGAVDTSEMDRAYKGIGSKYYDMVTESFDLTASYARQSIREVLREQLEI